MAPIEWYVLTFVDIAFVAVCIRTSTERPEAMERGCFTLAGISGKGLLQAVACAVALAEEGARPASVPDYADRNVSTKVVRIIQSYTGVVDKMVWRKPEGRGL